MKQYHSLLNRVIQQGVDKQDRTGTGTLSLFGAQTEYYLAVGFPLVNTKKVHFASIVHELLWFISGNTNIKYLTDNNVTIWNEWADENGDLGPVYGAQWRKWKTADGQYVDQLAEVVRLLKEDPDSRRIIMSAWNVGELDQMKLPPCHCFVQFYTEPMSEKERLHLYLSDSTFSSSDITTLLQFKRKHLTGTAFENVYTEILDRNNVPSRRLHCQLYQRSADVFLGVPYNIASYALLTMMLAQVTNMVPFRFVHTFGDVHLYSNHMEQAEQQLTREILPLPTVVLNKEIKNMDDFKFEDIQLLNYNSHPRITAPVAV